MTAQATETLTRAMIQTLTARHNADGWTVRDPAGGVWHPSEEAADEIEAADDPAARAVEICSTEPMRGTWKA